MHLLHHLSDHICHLENLLNESSESPEKAMTNLKQAYQQLNQHEDAFKMLQKNARKEVF